MKMKKILFVFLIISQSSFCQNLSSKDVHNSIYYELFGHSETILSVNYERLFTNENNNFIYIAGIGIGRNPGADEESINKRPAVTTFPIIGGILYGKKNHFAQLKIGYTPVFSKDYVDTSVNPNIIYKKFQSDYSLSMGYRFMANNGIVIQGFPIFIWSENQSKKFSVSFGLCIGYAF